MPTANRMVLGIMAQVAQFEVEQTSQRTKAAVHAESMREVLEAAKASGLSLRQIAAQLNEQDEHHPPRGESWKAVQVKRICDRLAIMLT